MSSFRLLVNDSCNISIYHVSFLFFIFMQLRNSHILSFLGADKVNKVSKTGESHSTFQLGISKYPAPKNTFNMSPNLSVFI